MHPDQPAWSALVAIQTGVASTKQHTPIFAFCNADCSLSGTLARRFRDAALLYRRLRV